MPSMCSHLWEPLILHLLGTLLLLPRLHRGKMGHGIRERGTTLPSTTGSGPRARRYGSFPMCCQFPLSGLRLALRKSVELETGEKQGIPKAGL